MGWCGTRADCNCPDYHKWRRKVRLLQWLEWTWPEPRIFLVQSLAHTFPKTILQSADSLVEAFIIQIPKLLKSFSLVKKWLNWYKCNYMIWWIQNGEFPRVTVWIEHSVFFLCSCYFCSHPMVLYVLVVSRNAFRSVLLLFIANLFSILILNYLSSVCCRMYG